MIHFVWPRSRPIKFCNVIISYLNFQMIEGSTKLFIFGKIAYVKQFMCHTMSIIPMCIVFEFFKCSLWKITYIGIFLHKYGEIFSLKLCFQFLEFWELNPCVFGMRQNFPSKVTCAVIPMQQTYLIKLGKY